MNWRAERIPAGVYKQPDSVVDSDMVFWIIDGDGNVVATVDKCEDKAADHARLIAAAPALLACVREFLALYDGISRDMLGDSVRAKLTRADAAIVKAEGQRH